jgi:hypothetical protein
VAGGVTCLGAYRQQALDPQGPPVGLDRAGCGGHLGAVHDLFDHGVVDPSDDQGPLQPHPALGVGGDLVPQQGAGPPVRSHMEGVVPRQTRRVTEPEHEVATGRVQGCDRVVDRAVSTVGTELHRAVETHGGDPRRPQLPVWSWHRDQQAPHRLGVGCDLPLVDVVDLGGAHREPEVWVLVATT